jgi:acyl dehydratase
LPGRYYEEFEPGAEFIHELSRTVTEHDNISFSLMTMNPQPLHIDSHFAAGTEWGRPLFNSMYTLAIMVGLSVQDTTLGTTIANLGMSDVRFPKPVFAGDTLSARTKVLGKRVSQSRPEAGIVEFEHICLNQKGETVALCRRHALMRRKGVA